jgi:hypothetical protein
METTTTRATFDWRDRMAEHLATSNLVTRETGRSMRELIELRLEREPEGTVVALDFSLTRASASWWRACRGWKYGDKYVVEG